MFDFKIMGIPMGVQLKCRNTVVKECHIQIGGDLAVVENPQAFVIGDFPHHHSFHIFLLK